MGQEEKEVREKPKTKPDMSDWDKPDVKNIKVEAMEKEKKSGKEKK